MLPRVVTLLVWASLTELLVSGTDGRSTARFARRKNTTAPPYVIDFTQKSIRTTILEATDYVCGRDQFCDNSNRSFDYDANCFRCESCNCDDRCHEFGDCCNDKATLNDGNQSRPLLSCETKMEERYEEQDNKKGYLVVTRCPQKETKDEWFRMVVKRCERPDFRDIQQATPVWVAAMNLTYRNQFCAVCNSQFAFKPWVLSAKCNASHSFHQVLSAEDIWPKVVDLECPIFTERPVGSYLRECRLNVVDTCNLEIQPPNSTLERFCERLTSAVKFNGTWYKNVFCAACNGVPFERTNQCDDVYGHRGSSYVPPLSVLLKFGPSHAPDQAVSDSAGRCPDRSLFNPMLGGCSPLSCPPRRALIGQTCRPIFQSCAGLGYSLSATLHAANPIRTNSSGYVSRRLERRLNKTLAVYSTYFRRKLRITIYGEKFLKPPKYVVVRSVSFTLEIVSTSNMSMADIERDLLRMTQEPWSFILQGRKLTFSPQNPQSGRNNTSTFINVKNKSDSPRVFGLRCERGECLKSVEYLPLNNLINCTFVEFNISDMHSNFSLQGNTIAVGNRTFSLRQNLFRTFAGRMKMCLSELDRFSNFLNQIQADREPNSASTQHPPWKSILSTVCLALSTIFLFLTFVVYCVARKLRTLAGKNTMALVFHLFFAQLLYLTGVNAVGNPYICQAVGVLIHYLWLAAFLWMFICAYHIFTVFTNLVSNNTQLSSRQRFERRNFRHYTLWCEIAPLVIILGSVAYGEASTGGASIGYGGELCFLNSNEAVGIFFASPLLVVLIFNVFFFVRAMLSITRTPDILRDNRQCERSYLGIYFRLSFLLGFGWTFGFLANINSVFFCLFIIFSGGQGIFIFFSFCFNFRTVNIVSETFPCLEHLLPKNNKYKHTETAGSAETCQ